MIQAVESARRPRLRRAASKVQSNAMQAFRDQMTPPAVSRDRARGRRLDLHPADVTSGLGRLVLTLVKLLHELLERQAIRRMESGSLTEDEVERLGTTLMRQAEEIERLRCQLGLSPEDLNLDLGPLGRLL